MGNRDRETVANRAAQRRARDQPSNCGSNTLLAWVSLAVIEERLSRALQHSAGDGAPTDARQKAKAESWLRTIGSHRRLRLVVACSLTTYAETRAKATSLHPRPTPYASPLNHWQDYNGAHESRR